MQYSPKLKKVMAEIKAIIKKNDIAGIVVLHTPGFGEYLNELSPSYSCAKLEGDQLRIKSKLVEEYKGDKKKQIQVLTDTSNMLSIIADIGGPIILGIMNASEMVDKHIDAEHGDGNWSAHEHQNN